MRGHGDQLAVGTVERENPAMQKGNCTKETLNFLIFRDWVVN
jgi:hypothetical protein